MWIKETKRKNRKTDLFTCDFETMVHNGKHIVVCFAIYGMSGKVIMTGTLKQLGWSGDESTLEYYSDALMTLFIGFCSIICKRKKNAIFYFHNFGRFDGLFVMSHITKYSKKEGYTWSTRDVFIKNNRLYTIKIKHNDTYIIFRDSHLIMNMKLEKVGESIGFAKDEFDFKTINITNLMDDAYLNGKLLKYNIRDCEVLYKGLIYYDKLMLDNYDMSIYNYLTSSSLALGVFLRRYYKDYTLYKESDQMDAFIRESYYGGSVDVYKPYGENITEYDVTSLYPSMMKANKYPIGKGHWTSGSMCDKLCKEKEFFGIIECEIIAPKRMYIGLIHCRDGTTTCVPRGHWKGVITSVEYYKALEIGYRINIIRGLRYRSGYIFKEYVDDTFSIRKGFIDKYGKDHGFSGLIKLQMNSLYGILGMKTTAPEVSLVDDKQLNKLSITKDVISIDELNDMNIVKYDKKISYKVLSDSLKNDAISMKDYEKEINKRVFDNGISCIQVATFVTAYSRCIMFDIKNKYKERLYYSDTDSVFIDGAMDDIDLGNGELGKMEYKNSFDRAYFIAPKLYMTIKDDKEKGVIKGIPKDQQKSDKLLVEKDFINMLNDVGKEVVYDKSFDVKFKKGVIMVKKQTINIRGRLNARLKVVVDNVWVNTYPIRYMWGKIVND